MSPLRALTPFIEKDLRRKMVFLAGPRQVGKTTLAKEILNRRQPGWYLNWDYTPDRETILREQFPGIQGLLVLDEIHKYSRWRQIVKGLFDKWGETLSILVTGSAKLDHYRHGGDSLQGRYHFYRLHPLSLAELGVPAQSTLDDLLAYGGFPEPFFLASARETARWSRDYRTRLVHEEVQSLERVKDISLLERLALRLPDLVGSPLSLNSLREDLRVAHSTIARWVEILENLYLIFRIYPFGPPAIRAVQKEAKHYHLDWTQIEEIGPRFENLVACHLRKWCDFLADTEGREVELRYFRTVDRKEVDFVLLGGGTPTHFIECKTNPSRETNSALATLKTRWPDAEALQISLKGGEESVDKKGVRHLPAWRFLNGLV